MHHSGFVCESHRAFGKEAWDFINKVATRDDTGAGADSHSYSPWGRPSWRRDFILAIGFAIQRGSATMLVRSDQRGRNRAGDQHTAVLAALAS